MVVAAIAPRVLLDGEPAGVVVDHVIDLAAAGGRGAARPLAMTVAQLDGSPQATGEEPGTYPEVDDPVAGPEHDPLDVGLGEDRQ